jgi:2-(1,2-epoxy-1,2-dihydrophenyl)acetyl-CoA isomerase
MTDTVEAADSGVCIGVEDAVLTLTLDRPDKGNALRNQDCVALRSAVEGADGDGDVRAILLRGGGRHFCAGADLVSANSADVKPTVGQLTRGLEAGAHGLIEALWHCPVPTVSAVHGKAINLGLHLAVVCDFVVAATDAEFIERFCKLGFCVDSGGSFLLPQLIGLRRARQMILRGIPVDAATAAEWGLVDEVVEPATLDGAVSDLVSELAAGPTFSLGHSKRLLNRRGSAQITTVLAQEAASVEATVRSADFKEGLRAFMEKRDPDFTGH